MNLHVLSINSHLYSTRRLVEEAQLAGSKVQVFSYQDLSSLPKKEFLPDVLIPRVAANMTQEGKLAIQHYETSKVPSVLNSAALLCVRNKFECLEQLRSAGLAVPKSQLIKHDTNLDVLFPAYFQFPVLLKLAESTHGHGVLLIQTKQGLKRMMQTFKQFQPFVLQEFIREAAGSDIRAFVVGNRVVASMKRIAKKGDFRSNLHRGGRAKSIELSENEEQMVLQAAKVVGIGVAGIDLIMSAKGLMIIEINASPGLEGIEKVSGENIARKIVQYAKSLL